MPLRIMLDTMICDRLIATPMLNQLNELVAFGELDILTTHVQEDELAGIRDPSKWAAASRVPRRGIPTAIFVVGISRLGLARLREPIQGGVEYDDIRTENGRHVRDAVIACTAARDADILVTEDRRLAHRVRRSAESLRVWSFDDLAIHIEALTAGLK